MNMIDRKTEPTDQNDQLLSVGDKERFSWCLFEKIQTDNIFKNFEKFKST